MEFTIQKEDICIIRQALSDYIKNKQHRPIESVMKAQKYLISICDKNLKNLDVRPSRFNRKIRYEKIKNSKFAEENN